MFVAVVVTCQMHHLDAVNVQAFVVDQPLGHNKRSRRVIRLNVDLSLKALETMAVGIQQVLIERYTIGVHFRTPHSSTLQSRPINFQIDPALGVHIAQALAIAQHDLPSSGKSEHALVMELRQRPRYRFQCQAEIVADVTAAHR